MANTLTPTKIKELISDPKNKIKLHELVDAETEKLYSLISNFEMHSQDNIAIEEQARLWMKKIETESEILRKIFAYGCYFGVEEQKYAWTRALSRLGGVPHTNGRTVLLELQLYPALLVFFTGGISSVSAKNSVSLGSVFNAKYHRPYREPNLLALDAHGFLLSRDIANQILGLKKKTPLSDHVHDILKDSYPKSLVGEDNFSAEFNRWELILAMFVAHSLKDRPSGPWAPIGRFGWQGRMEGEDILKLMEKEIKQEQSPTSLLVRDLLNGSVEDVLKPLEVVGSMATQFDWL